MAKHHPTDDADARSIAENRIADAIMPGVGLITGLDERESALAVARAVVAAFPYVEMDAEVVRVRGGNHPVALRRLILTGEWETDPAARPS